MIIIAIMMVIVITKQTRRRRGRWRKAISIIIAIIVNYIKCFIIFQIINDVNRWGGGSCCIITWYLIWYVSFLSLSLSFISSTFFFLSRLFSLSLSLFSLPFFSFSVLLCYPFHDVAIWIMHSLAWYKPFSLRLYFTHILIYFLSLSSSR